jgi:diguanylate cyclase (GGDEF)-like protein
VSEPGGPLTLVSSLNCDPEYLQQFARLPSGIPWVDSVLRAGRVQFLGPDEADDATLRLNRRFTHGSALLVPLLSPGGAQGIIALRFEEDAPHDAETAEWLRTLGMLLGAAIVNARLYAMVDAHARTDVLTGLGSRRHFEELLRRELARARRAGSPLSLVMLDVDGLKQINDTWGHVIGDQVLQAVGEVLHDTRATDVAARFGGDEFVLLLPETTVQDAEVVVRRIRARCGRLNEQQRFPFPLRLSIGVRQMTHLDTDLVSEADAAMYADKRRRAAHLNPLEDLPEGVNDGEEADEWQAHHGEHNNGSG